MSQSTIDCNAILDTNAALSMAASHDRPSPEANGPPAAEYPAPHDANVTTSSQPQFPPMQSWAAGLPEEMQDWPQATIAMLERQGWRREYGAVTVVEPPGQFSQLGFDWPGKAEQDKEQKVRQLLGVGIDPSSEQPIKYAGPLPASVQQYLYHDDAEDGMLLGDLLDADIPRLEICRNVVIDGQCTLLAGPAGVGKTLMAAVNLPLSIATGGKWLEQERFACDRPRRVSVWSTESGPSTLQRHFDSMLNAKVANLLPADQAAVRTLARQNVRIYAGNMPDLSTAGGLRTWAQKLARHQAEVAFVEPVLSALGAADMADPGKMYRVLDDLRKAAFDVGVLSVVLAHHTVVERGQKRRGYQVPTIEQAAYPVFVRWARQKIAIGPAGEYDPARHATELYMSIKGSGLISGGLFRLSFEEGANYDAWQVTACETYRQSRERNDEQAATAIMAQETAVLTYLYEAQQRGRIGETKTRIAARIGLGRNSEAIARLLSRLEDRRLVRLAQRPGGHTDHLGESCGKEAQVYVYSHGLPIRPVSTE